MKSQPVTPATRGTPKAAKRLLYYELHGKVTRRDVVPRDEERTQIIRNCLPADAHTILDVGCGVGLVTRTLAPERTVIGVDVSLDVHRGAEGSRVCGAGTSLPFRDSTFDLVLATQIFEHLTDSDLSAVVLEMHRVARRYILITTTYREDVQEASVPCPACGAVFNAYGHLRTFDESLLEAAFPHCKVRLTRTYARQRVYPHSLVLLNQKLLGFWHFELALVCTECGHDRFPAPRSGLAELSRLTNALARILPLRSRPTRILMLFEKT